MVCLLGMLAAPGSLELSEVPEVWRCSSVSGWT